MSQRSLKDRFRDALFEHLVPPFAGLAATFVAGPVAGVGASGVVAACAKTFLSYEERKRAERRLYDIADNAVATLAEFVDAELRSDVSKRTLNPEAVATAIGKVLEDALSAGVFFHHIRTSQTREFDAGYYRSEGHFAFG